MLQKNASQRAEEAVTASLKEIQFEVPLENIM